MPIMTANDAGATLIFLVVVVIIWADHNLHHGNNVAVASINAFWLGAISFMIMFYIFFSKAGY